MSLIKFKADDVRLRRALRRLKLSLKDNRPMFDRMGAEMVAVTQGRFEEQKDPQGNAWKPLSMATRVARIGGTKKIFTAKTGRVRKGSMERMGAMKALQHEGHLLQSLTHLASSRGALMGSNMPYARLQNDGGMAGRGNKVEVPARPFIGVSKDDEKLLANIMIEFAEKAVS